MGQRIQDRKLHAWQTHLSHDTSVDELDERVNDALRVHHYVDAIVRKAEKKMCLDDFECLVRERRRIDGDLPPHRPRWMPQRFFERRARELIVAPSAEWSPGSREDYSAHIGVRPARYALKNRAVLAVNRHYLATTVDARLRGQRARNDESLLVGQSYALSRAQRGQSCVESRSADDCIENNVGSGKCRCVDETLDPHVPSFATILSAVHETHVRRREFIFLLGKQCCVAVCSERSHIESFALPCKHPKGSGPYRACR